MSELPALGNDAPLLPSPGTPGEGKGGGGVGEGQGVIRHSDDAPPPHPSPGVPGEGESAAAKRTSHPLQYAGKGLLEVEDVSIAFGGLKAVQHFNLSLPPGSLYGLIGPNGAGKTTAFNLLTGVYRPDGGSVQLCGKRVDGKRPHQIARAGLARTFQNIRLFGELSVLDNIRVGGQMRVSHGMCSTILRTRGYIAAERTINQHAIELLELFGLRAQLREQAKNLAYGSQRRLEIARALATKPKVLLLDEPAAGMNPQEKIELMKLIRFIRDKFSLAILLIEHDMTLVMNVCERITVLDHGETIAEGTPEAIRCHPQVIEAYLGQGAEGADS